jgi:enamine deaminase RidA (YjgF/YER057c/UK114 family)
MNDSSMPVVDRRPDTSSAICYRMQPARQMFTGGYCSHACGIAAGGLANRMPPCLLSDQQHTVVEFGDAHRMVLMITPQAIGRAIDQAWEAVSTVRVILNQQPFPMTLSMQTVFVRRAEDIEPFRNLFEAYYGKRMPPTSFIVQPPCGGQALAIEAWAVGGERVEIQHPAVDVMTVSHDDLRWIHIAGVVAPEPTIDAYGQAAALFAELTKRLALCGASFRDIPRIWLYQGGITRNESSLASPALVQRYQEMNRARTDYFEEMQGWGLMNTDDKGHVIYPASTGIGMAGRGLTLSCLGLQTQRSDVRLIALENPQQTSAFDYAHRFSAKSPKFSRAMAIAIGDYLTTWISGTASILNSETVHAGDIERQTHQTIDNIQRLIAAENFARHGANGAGAELSDLAKVRVYVKHLEDFEKCRAICHQRLGDLPTIYARADVCRSDLLVEIEGVAFSRVAV